MLSKYDSTIIGFIIIQLFLYTITFFFYLIVVSSSTIILLSPFAFHVISQNINFYHQFRLFHVFPCVIAHKKHNYLSMLLKSMIALCFSPFTSFETASLFLIFSKFLLHVKCHFLIILQKRCLLDLTCLSFANQIDKVNALSIVSNANI